MAEAVTATGDKARKLKQLRARADAAWTRRKNNDARMHDIYTYVMPFRDPTGIQGIAATAEGQSRLDLCFDSTALIAAFRFPGKMQRLLTPVFDDFMALAAGPLVPDGEEKKKLTETLQSIADIVHGLLNGARFPTAVHEFYADLYAGTAHMQVLDTGDDNDPMLCRTIPYAKVAIEDGPFGETEHWFYKDTWRVDELPTLWPKAELSQRIKDAIENSPEKTTEVCQYTYLDRKKKKFVLLVWCDMQEEQDVPLWTEETRTCPWITARFWKLSDEAYGRGPPDMAMPTVKTLNMAQELAMKAAAFAIMGIWTYRNDRHFNPATVRFEPRAMWPVGSNGGPMGDTVKRLPIPQDFDISAIVIKDQQEQAKKCLLDDNLPAVTEAVRSPTEILQRVQQENADLGGVLGRATLEIVVPLVKRAIDILETRRKLPTNIKIDQIFTQVRVIAPIAAAQQAAKAQGFVNWVQLLSGIGGQQLAMLAAKLEDAAPELGRWLGVPEKFIRGPDDRKKILEMVAQLLAQQQAAQAAAAAPPPPSPAEERQDILNGSPM